MAKNEHDEALLLSGSGKLGIPGSAVSIQAVERAYGSSEEANASEKFKCLNQHCPAEVSAVIQKLKADGSQGPASHFRATTSHMSGCSRKRDELGKPKPAKFDPAAEVKGGKSKVATVWIPPAQPQPTTTGGTSGGNAGSPSPSGTGATTSGHGNLIRRSHLVKTFAKQWLSMTPQERKDTPLQAKWNSGASGTFDSAFNDLRGAPPIDSIGTAQAIHVGTIESVQQIRTGYAITLTQQSNTGLTLLIWIKHSVENDTDGGSALWKRLKANSFTGNPKVFALGQFRLQGKQKKWLSLELSAAEDLWVDTNP